jgi:hypothetical protein
MSDIISTSKEVDQFIDTLPIDIQNLVVVLRGIILPEIFTRATQEAMSLNGAK